MNVEVTAKRVRAEFEEMPGMTLTVPQASRLFGLDHETCNAIVERLIGTAFLQRTENGAITRLVR